jgi:hypothetical protein
MKKIIEPAASPVTAELASCELAAIGGGMPSGRYGGRVEGGRQELPQPSYGRDRGGGRPQPDPTFPRPEPVQGDGRLPPSRGDFKSGNDNYYSMYGH